MYFVMDVSTTRCFYCVWFMGITIAVFSTINTFIFMVTIETMSYFPSRKHKSTYSNALCYISSCHSVSRDISFYYMLSATVTITLISVTMFWTNVFFENIKFFFLIDKMILLHWCISDLVPVCDPSVSFGSLWGQGHILGNLFWQALLVFLYHGTSFIKHFWFVLVFD